MSESNPNQDHESEKAVIGCILLNNEVIENVVEILSSADFSNRTFQQVYGAMQKMYERNEPLEVLSVAQRTKDLYPNTEATSESLEEIQNSSPAPSSVDFYAQRVVRSFLKREAKKLLKNAEKEINDSDDVLSKISETVSKMEAIRSESVEQTVFSVQDLFVKRAEYIEAKQDGRIESNIMRTGLDDLDTLLGGGLRYQHFDVLAARPAMGKTSLAVQFLLNASLHEKINCLMFSIEMSKEEIMDKMISIESGIPYRTLSSANLEDEDWERIVDIAGKILRNPEKEGENGSGILIDDVTKDLNRMVSIIRRCVRKHGIKFVVIDYLQLIAIAGKFGTRDEQLGHAVNLLAYTAKTLNINILALSQLNRAVESRETKRPSLSDLRESGNIEQAAWRVMSIYRDDYYNFDSNDKGVAEISVLKGKISNTGKVQVHFNQDCTSFHNFEWRRDEN